MTDAVLVATIGGTAVLLARALSYLENKKTITVVEKIHTLVNSNMGGQLRVNMLQARRIAELTKLPSDVELATESERLYNEHMAKQKIVDSA